MPTDVWTAELSFDSFAYTHNPDPTGSRFDSFWVGLEAVCLPLLDPFPPFNPSPDEGNFFLAVGQNDTPTFFFPAPGAFQIVTVRLGNAEIQPPQWARPFIITTFSGGSPTLLAGSVTLSITKDYDADLMTFTGPLGTATCSLTGIDALPGGPYGYTNTTPLRPRGFAQRLQLPEPSGLDPAYDVDDRVKWYNLVGKQNGVPYDTVALSAADPGSWWPINSRAFNPSTGTFDPGLAPWWTYTQETAREAVRAQVFAADFPIWRDFITWKRRREPMPLEQIDLACYRPTRTLFGVWNSMPTEVMARRSQDNGETWITTIVEDTTPADSLSIQTAGGEVWVAYFDGAQIVTQKSADFGLTWSAAMPVSITGTNPRLVISPEGVQFYFYITGGNLVLSRSYDFGATISDVVPITVANVVTPQDFGAVLGPDRRLSVAFIVLGNWITRASDDWGETWFDA